MKFFHAFKQSIVSASALSEIVYYAGCHPGKEGTI